MEGSPKFVAGSVQFWREALILSMTGRAAARALRSWSVSVPRIPAITWLRRRFAEGQARALKFDDLFRGTGHADSEVPGNLADALALAEHHLEGAELGRTEFAVRVEAADQVDAVAQGFAEAAGKFLQLGVVVIHR